MSLGAETFTCKRCGACCRVPGFVRLTEADILALSQALGMSTEAFIEEWTMLSPSRTGLVVKADPESPCPFLTEDNLCRVHTARPQQCRDYPSRWRSEAIEAVCEARKEQV